MVHIKKNPYTKQQKTLHQQVTRVIVCQHPNVGDDLAFEPLRMGTTPTGGLMGSYAAVLCVEGVFPLVSLSSRAEVS